MATFRHSEQLVDVGSKFGASVRTVSLDVTNEAQAQYDVDAAIETFGGLDVLGNNAGYGNVCPVEDTSLSDFRERRSGHIIQISSISKFSRPIGSGRNLSISTDCRLPGKRTDCGKRTLVEARHDANGQVRLRDDTSRILVDVADMNWIYIIGFT